MAEKEGLIAISDPKWENVLLIKETELEGIINYLNSKNVKATPSKGYNYIKKFAISIVDSAEYEKDFDQHILPFQDLIPIPQKLNPEKCRKAYTCIKSCRISFIDFSNKPDGEYEHIMIFQDQATKFTILKALKSLDESEIYNCLIGIFSLIGVPSTIITSAKSKIKLILEGLSFFCENFDSKVELSKEEEEDQNSQQFKDLVEEWMDINKSKEWHNGLYFIQFRSNCNYDPKLNASPFDMLFKPNYEYVRRKFTRYLLHKTKINNNSMVCKETDTEFTNDNSEHKRMNKPLEAKNTPETNDETNEYYLAIEPGNNEKSKYEDHNSLLHIFENTNKYSLSEKDKNPSVEDTDSKHIVVYKINKKYDGTTPKAFVKLEPVNVQETTTSPDWVCKVREVNKIDHDSPKNRGSECHDQESGIPSSIYLKFQDEDEKNLVQTFRKELKNAPATICLVCRKKKRNNSQDLNFARVGMPVRLRTSIQDRQKGHPNFILAVVVDITPTGEYILGTPKGILNEIYPSDALLKCNHTQFTLDDVPRNKFIDITEAVREQMKLSDKILMKCTCYRQIGNCNPKFTYHNRCSVHFQTEKLKEMH